MSGFWTDLGSEPRVGMTPENVFVTLAGGGEGSSILIRFIEVVLYNRAVTDH